MKILKKGNYFKAYNDKNEEVGSISIKTGKFVGATVCMLELSQKLDEYNNTIKIGDLVYNPLSNVVMTIDKEDDLKYVNDNYFKVSPEDLRLSIDQESINIYFDPPVEDVDQLQVAYWHLDEVEEDATVAISMVRAVELFYTNPKELLETLKQYRLKT